MSNGHGPLTNDDALNTIRYDGREYRLRSSWSNRGSYIEIGGLDPDVHAGPWGGGPEIDCERGQVTLPDEVAVQAAAAILLAHVDSAIDPFDQDAFSEFFDNIEDRATFVKLLDMLARGTAPAAPTEKEPTP